ncbi:MAG: MFS transporter [Clostridia bacterium]|nr:MFS transporter [Clostridia bacterium]
MKKPITNKVLWLFAVGQFGWSLLSGIITSWLVFYYIPAENSANSGILGTGFITQKPVFLTLTIFGLIMMVGRIFDAVTDPLVASWSDGSNFRGGRRIPFMKAVAVPFALSTVAVFVLPSFAGKEILNDALVFVLLILFYFFMTVYCTPYNALIAELGDTQEHRINVSTYISFTYIAGLSMAYLVPNIAGVFEASLGVANSVRLAIGIMAAVACVAMLVPSFFIKERDYIDSKPVKTPVFRSLFQTYRNGQFRRFVYSDVIYFFAVTLFQTGLAYYETVLMGLDESYTFLLTVIMTVVSLALYVPVNRLAPKLGKKKLIVTGFFAYSFVFALTSVCGLFGIPAMVWGITIAVCAGVPMAILGILPQACVADVSELDALESGESRSGMFFAARTFAMKLGQAIAVIVFTSMTASTGDGSSAGPMKYRWTAIIATAACLIGAVIFLSYDEKKLLGRIDDIKKARGGENPAQE